MSRAASAGPVSERDVYLGLGSNEGDRASILREALEHIRAWDEVREVEASPCYETEYVGPFGPQSPYLNLCARVRTSLGMRELLTRTRRLERESGRREDAHMRPRPLDVDLLVDGDVVVEEPSLQVPHPRLRGRRFVLQPLSDLAPGLRLPPDGARVSELLDDPQVRSQSLRRWEA